MRVDEADTPLELEVHARSAPIETLTLPSDPLDPRVPPTPPEVAFQPIPEPEEDPTSLVTAAEPAPFVDEFSRGLDGPEGPLTIGVGGSGGRAGSAGW